MRLLPTEHDVTARIFADTRDEDIPADVRECCQEDHWQSVQNAGQKVGSKHERRKIQ